MCSIVISAIWGYPDPLHCNKAQGLCNDILFRYQSCTECNASIAEQTSEEEKAGHSFFHPKGSFVVLLLFSDTPTKALLGMIVVLILQENPSDKDLNQGTLVIFNLDPSVSNEEVRQIFGAYGEVKEVSMQSIVSLHSAFDPPLFVLTALVSVCR